jgi:prolyl-tRNA synthetase
MVLAETGEDAILACPRCPYAANLERAVSAWEPTSDPEEGPRPRRKVPTPGRKTVEEVTRFLSVSPDRLVKTLIYQTASGPAAILVRGDLEVNETKVLRVLGVDDLTLAEDAVVERITGAPVGFAGAVGLSVPVWADETLKNLKNFVMGANEADHHWVDLNWETDVPRPRWADLRQVKAGEPCPRCGTALDTSRGIEVGHVFKLGDKYSRSMKAVYLDARGQEQLMVMGCYGIGVGRTVAAAIEQNHDGDGIVWPLALAPFQVIITPTEVDPESETFRTARSLYDRFRSAGIEVLLDDRDERPGIKFKDADLIGIPLRVTVGPKGLKENVVELRPRAEKTVQRVPVDQCPEVVQAYVARGISVE